MDGSVVVPAPLSRDRSAFEDRPNQPSGLPSLVAAYFEAAKTGAAVLLGVGR